MTNSNVRNPLKYWYIPAIVGLLFIAVGIYAFTVPMETYLTLTVIFSISFLTSGLLESIFAIQNRKFIESWGWYLVSGIAGIILGILLLVNPEISVMTLPLFVGFGLLFRSIIGLGLAFDLKKMRILQWGNLALLSALGILSSFLLIYNPIFTGFSIVVFTCITFIFTGVSAIILSFRLKKLK